LARRNSEAMYLRETYEEQTFLYLEQDQGRTLGILDVTDLGAIRAAGQVSLLVKSPYDFVVPLQDSAALVRYRDHLGFAIIDFRKPKKPVLTEAPEFQQLAYAETLGNDGLVFSRTVASEARVEDPQYKVVDVSVSDVSNPSEPAAIAAVEGVRQRLDRIETGTLFMLGNAGLTVVRRPAAEEEYKRQSSIIHSP
jgi:hypothetical protein